jgi:hypothetical protein
MLPFVTPTLDAAKLVTALADIDAILRTAPNDAALASAVRKVFDSRPLPGLRCALGPGSSGEDVARLIGSLLLAVPIAFTVILAMLTRARPRVQAYPGREGHTRPLTADEAADLHLPADTGVQGWHRDGTMEAGGIIAGDCSVTLLPDLIPAAKMAMIEAGTPVGMALDGMTRTDTTVALRWPDEPGLLAAAVLCYDGQRAGLAAERISSEALDRIAKGCYQ